MEPNWLRVIEGWRAQDAEKVGPSFPFLFGALSNPIGKVARDEDSVRRTFLSLLDEIAAYDIDGKYFAVRRCRNVSGHFIISPEDAIGEHGGITYFIGCANEAESRALVWQESREHILNGRFSFRDSEFRPYNDGELGLIRNALS